MGGGFQCGKTAKIPKLNLPNDKVHDGRGHELEERNEEGHHSTPEHVHTKAAHCTQHTKQEDSVLYCI